MALGRIRTARTGHLTAFSRAYQARAAQSPISLRDWVATEYDPESLKRDFSPGRWSDFLVDRILRRE